MKAIKKLVSKWLLKDFLDKVPFNNYKLYISLMALLLADCLQHGPCMGVQLFEWAAYVLGSVGADPVSLQGTLVAVVALAVYHKGLKLIAWILNLLDKDDGGN